MQRTIRTILLALMGSMVFSSCFLIYTFKDISIAPDVKTFYVEEFENNAFNSPATINQDFTEALRRKIIDETSLKEDEKEPHVVFSGSIKKYEIIPQAPTPDGAALNRLNIMVEVSYDNTLHEKESWKKQFSYYSDFPQDQDLNSVQDALIRDIFEHILDDVINKAFNNW